jgi:hypothetical protein
MKLFLLILVMSILATSIFDNQVNALNMPKC